MKSSLYNVYKKGESEYVLFNTLTNAAAYIDAETKRLLEENPDAISGDIKEMFLENGFVVEDDCDERKIVRYHFDKNKYNVNPHNLSYAVAMTYACNLKCPYCYEGPEKDTETMDNKRVDILLKNIDKNLSKKDFKMLKITLYGGEPLVAYQQCVRLMEGAFKICDEQNKEFRGNMLTNGVLITEDVVDTLLKPYCHWVQITMDGGREAHNQRRIRKDGSGTYDTLLHVLELLRDAGIQFTLNLNVDRENADTFSELYQDLRDRGLENVKKSLGRIHPVDTGGGRGCSSYATVAEKCFSYDEMADSAHKIYELMGDIWNSQKSVGIPRQGFCQFDREDSFTIDPYFFIYKCAGFLGKKDKKVGHIDEHGETIFNYEYYKQMSRNPLELEECRTCKYVPVCVGGCAAQSYFENGTYHSSPCTKHRSSHLKYVESSIDGIIEKLCSP